MKLLKDICVTVNGLLTNLFLDGVEPEVELDEVREDGVEVRVQLQQDDLPEVGVVDVGEHVEEQPVDLPDVRVERRGELLALHGQIHCVIDDCEE